MSVGQDSVTLRLATRKSQLALAQARAFASELCANHPGLQIAELQVVTTGDRIQDRPLAEVGGKGVFVKEIEQALLEGRADFAVHSIKDVPAELAPGLRIECVPRRADARDVLVSKTGEHFLALRPGTIVGTSSLRRSTLLKNARPDLKFTPLRGNVDTRLRKVREGEVEAAILAKAGLDRLGLTDSITEVLPPELCVPAVGQGALGIECREEDLDLRALLRAMHDPDTAIAVAVERGVLKAVEGNCRMPLAAYATGDKEGGLLLRAMLAEPDGSNLRVCEEHTSWPSSECEAETFGREIGLRLHG